MIVFIKKKVNADSQKLIDFTKKLYVCFLRLKNDGAPKLVSVVVSLLGAPNFAPCPCKNDFFDQDALPMALGRTFFKNMSLANFCPLQKVLW